LAGYVVEEPMIGERLVEQAADEALGHHRRRRQRTYSGPLFSDNYLRGYPAM